MAVACGHTESIAKLFSIQRRRIQTLERSSVEAQQNNEEVERCLNFLSREYVEMRYQVRKGPTKKGEGETRTIPEKEEARDVEESKDKDFKDSEKEATKPGQPGQNDMSEGKDKETDEEPLLIEDVEEGEQKHTSEPEKEPSLSARQSQAAAADKVQSAESRQNAEVIQEDKELNCKPVPDRMHRHSYGQAHPPCLLGSMATSPKGVGVSPKTASSRHRGTPTSEHPHHPSRHGPHSSHGSHGTRRSHADPPTVSPKDRSPYTSTAVEGFDRRGHKLAMAHQRVLNRRALGVACGVRSPTRPS